MAFVPRGEPCKAIYIRSDHIEAPYCDPYPGVGCGCGRAPERVRLDPRRPDRRLSDMECMGTSDRQTTMVSSAPTATLFDSHPSFFFSPLTASLFD